jgi:hypothetical protein
LAPCGGWTQHGGQAKKQEKEYFHGIVEGLVRRQIAVIWGTQQAFSHGNAGIS